MTLMNVFLLLSIPGIIFCGYGIGWFSILSSNEEEFGIHKIIVVAMTLILIGQQAFFHSAVSVFLIMFGDTIFKLSSWCNSIKDEVSIVLSRIA